MGAPAWTGEEGMNANEHFPTINSAVAYLGNTLSGAYRTRHSIPAQHWHMTCAQGGDVFSFAGASESDEVPAGSIEKECVNRL